MVRSWYARIDTAQIADSSQNVALYGDPSGIRTRLDLPQIADSGPNSAEQFGTGLVRRLSPPHGTSRPVRGDADEREGSRHQLPGTEDRGQGSNLHADRARGDSARDSGSTDRLHTVSKAMIVLLVALLGCGPTDYGSCDLSRCPESAAKVWFIRDACVCSDANGYPIARLRPTTEDQRYDKVECSEMGKP